MYSDQTIVNNLGKMSVAGPSWGLDIVLSPLRAWPDPHNFQ
jgi:hypothetical protein